MTLRQKVGQMFFVRPEALELGAYASAPEKNEKQPSVRLTDAMRAHFEEYPAGGVILFAPNCVDSTQLKRFTSDIHSLPCRPLVCVDEEGGKVLRIGGRPGFGVVATPFMSSVAASSGEAGVRQAVNNIARYLASYGIDVDFAPVADVNSNPSNPVIGKRSFGSDPAMVSAMVAAAVREFGSCGIPCCLKHFPGHGDTATDSHKGYASTSKTWSQMLSCEIKPFRSGIEAGVPMVMTAHITAPGVDPSCVPSTLSHVVLTGKLRGELGFNGVIITDSMSMGAITNEYSSAQAAVMAVMAGVDVILCPLHYEKAFEAVLAAVRDGRISEQRIDESVARIIELKYLCRQ